MSILEAEKTKLCTGCNLEYPITTEFFHKNNKNKDGFNWQCKVCLKKYRQGLTAKFADQRERNLVDSSPIKTCSLCQNEYPLTIEYFVRASHKKDGFAATCKKCDRIKRKEFYERNKDRLQKIRNNDRDKYRELGRRYYNKEKAHQYHADNKERINKKSNEWYLENRDKILRDKRMYYAEHKEEFIKFRIEHREDRRIYCKKYMLSHPGYAKVYGRKNRELVNLYTRRRRSRLANLLSTLTIDQLKESYNFFDNKCAYCGSNINLSQDHVIPVTKDGFYVRTNIIPACGSCNSSKRNLNMEDWYHGESFFSEIKLRKIQKWIGYNNKNKTQQLAMF